MLLFVLVVAAASSFATAGSPAVVKWGIVTDVHYADADTEGTRVYRDGLDKIKAACRDFTSGGADFVVELGDFKDTDISQGCDNDPSPHCVNITVGFLRTIDAALAEGFQGPRFHVLGNHDVDVLNQTIVLANEQNSPVPAPGPAGPGWFSWSFPPTSPPKSKSQPVSFHQPLRFIVLNGDFTDHDQPWGDLDSPFPGEAWNKANVPSFQLTWLAQQLDAARAQGQRVVVFVHYRLDGGPGGPVGQGIGPPLPAKNRPWIDECTLQNAEVVRALLERDPGLVLATFSGHDHTPQPPWTKQAADMPLYWTHSAMVEGHFPASNAYSLVTVHADCSITVKGFGNATSAVVSGPSNCTLIL